MALKDAIFFIDKIRLGLNSRLRKFYLNSSFYNKKISRIDNKNLIYKPSPSLFDCLVKYNKQKNNIDDFDLETIWKIENMNDKSKFKLNSFFWLFTIDLKSSRNKVQSILEKWMDNNIRYSNKVWDLNVLSKRIISWISNTKLTYDDGKESYKEKFNYLIRKQVNHLKFEIDRSNIIEDKVIGCVAIMLTGLSYKDQNFLEYGFKLLSKIIQISFDSEGFPKSRSFRQLIFYLKYFILVRELLKETNNDIPEYLDETIYYLGQSYNLFCQNKKISNLFNGNHEIKNETFDKYLELYGYKFNCKLNEIGGYALIKDNKSQIIMDVGRPPEKKFSQNYQSGALSFEFSYLNNKIITNSGYFQKEKHQLNSMSRSSVAHSTLIIDDTSIVKFNNGIYGEKYVKKYFNIIRKKVIKDNDKWFLQAAHDSYKKKYNIIHERQIEFFSKKFLLKGKDILEKKDKNLHYNFEIRFHLHPNIKATKTIDNKSILLELEDSGWKFVSENNTIDIETGLYFGKKNFYSENRNIFISGKIKNEKQIINWEIKKI